VDAAPGPGRPLYTWEQIEELGLVGVGNGFLVDPDTGEVTENRREPFRVHDVETAAFVIGRMQERDAEVVKQFTLYLAQCGPILAALRAAMRERDFFEARFKPELEIFAAQNLLAENASLPANKQVSNVKLPGGGKLQFGTSVATIDIPEETMEHAIRWAEQFVPSAVEKRLVKTPLKGHEAELPVAFFSVIPPRRWFAVQTGVKVPAEAERLAKTKAP
jgi:hypothetical protein